MNEAIDLFRVLLQHNKEKCWYACEGELLPIILVLKTHSFKAIHETNLHQMWGHVAALSWAFDLAVSNEEQRSIISLFSSDIQ